MSTEKLLPEDLRAPCHVKQWRNATGALATACPSEWQDIQDVLRSFRLMKSEVITGRGNRSAISRRIDGALYARGWQEKTFSTSIVVDQNRIDSPAHAVDCFKDGVALEMEWNHKDPFFDRNLNNFGLLFELRAIQTGIIIARSWELEEIFRKLGKGSSYGASTTHHERLWPEVEDGGGGGCPILTFANRPALFVDDVS